MKLLIILTCILLIACSDENSKTKTQSISNAKEVAYPYHSSDGNRFVSGISNLPNITAVEISLSAEARWITALKSGNDSIWAVVLSNGNTKAYKVNNGGYEEINILPGNIGTDMPITTVLNENNTVVIANNFSDGSRYSNPVIVDKTTGSRAYIASNGDLVLQQDDTTQRLKIDAVKYSRLLIDDNKNLLLLAKPTLSYDHQVLGSTHPNAASIVRISTSPTFEVLSTIDISTPDVIEGNPLIWKDLNADGTNEIVTTLSNITEGARIVVFNEDGSIYAEGNPINQGYRWRHQLAIAPFNSDSQLDLISIYIPHLGPHIETFRLDDGSMSENRFSVNYSSHLQISLNLDKSITGDFDNDGKPEVLLISRDNASELAAYSISNNIVNKDWTLDLSNEVSSNIAAVTLENNSIALGIGQGNQLRVWHP